MTKHTEGPWAVDTGMEVHKDGVTIFAWPEYSAMPDVEILANMALGAAAPELLEAAEKCDRILAAGIQNSEGRDVVDAMTSLRTAIAKARREPA